MKKNIGFLFGLMIICCCFGCKQEPVDARYLQAEYVQTRIRAISSNVVEKNVDRKRIVGKYFIVMAMVDINESKMKLQKTYIKLFLSLLRIMGLCMNQFL